MPESDETMKGISVPCWVRFDVGFEHNEGVQPSHVN